MKKKAGFLLTAAAVLCCLAVLAGLPKKAETGFRSKVPASGFTGPQLPNGTVRVNEADLEELVLIPGIGETLGQAILDERKKNGDFHYPEDLLAVRGIGRSKLEQIRPWLDLSDN
jgi:competence ComEA-like helix-hairpin-helix protein